MLRSMWQMGASRTIKPSEASGELSVDHYFDIRVPEPISVALQMIREFIASLLKGPAQRVKVGLRYKDPHCKLQAPSPSDSDKSPVSLM